MEMRELIESKSLDKLGRFANLDEIFDQAAMKKVVGIYLKCRNVNDFIKKALKAKIDTLEGLRTSEQLWHDIWFALWHAQEDLKA